MNTLFSSAFALRLTSVSVIALLALNTTACQRFKKSDNMNEPTPLVQLANDKTTLNPIFSQNLSGKSKSFKNKKQTLTQSTTAFKTTVDTQGYISASPDGTVVATDNNGKMLWQVELKQGLHAGVALDNAQTFATTVIVADNLGKLIALDRATGNIRWERQLSSNVLSPALISGNRVVALANNGLIYGLSLQTGDVIWQFGTQNPSLSVRGSATPILLDTKTAIIPTADGRIHALNIDNGSPLWSRRVSMSVGASEIDRLSDIDATPVFVDNMLYVTTYSGQLVAFDMSSRQLAFVKEIASLKSVAVDNSQVYATTLDGSVVAFDRFTGNENWQVESLKYRGLSNPIVTSNYVVVGDKLGYLHSLDKNSGQIVGRSQSKTDINALTSQPNSKRIIAQSQNGSFSVWQSVD